MPDMNTTGFAARLLTQDNAANDLWRGLVNGMVALYSEFQPDRALPESHELADHVQCRIREILDRAGVDIVPGESPATPATRHAINAANLDNRAWVKLVEETVELFDELKHHEPDFDAPKQALSRTITGRLQQVLEQAGVETIGKEGEPADRKRHKHPGSMAMKLDTYTVGSVLKPGFACTNRVFTRADVILESRR